MHTDPGRVSTYRLRLSCIGSRIGPPPKWFVTLNLPEGQEYQLNASVFTFGDANVSSALVGSIFIGSNSSKILQYRVQQLCAADDWAYARFELVNLTIGTLSFTIILILHLFDSHKLAHAVLVVFAKSHMSYPFLLCW